MSMKQWFAAAFLILAGSVTFILVFAYTGLLMYQIGFEEDQFAEDTTVAGVDVSGMHRTEAVETVREALEDWQEETRMSLTWYDEEIPLDREDVLFLVEPTIDRLLQEETPRSSGLIVTADGQALEDAVDSFSFRDDMTEAVDVESLQLTVQEEAGDLPPGDVNWMLHPHLTAEAEPEEQILMEAVRPGVVTPELEAVIAGSDMIPVPGKSDVSVLSHLNLPEDADVEEEALAAVGSAVFEASSFSNFTVEERHQRYALLDSVPLGFDAHLEPERRDFQFYNPNDYSYEIQLTTNGTDLTVALYGYEFPYDIDVQVEETDSVGTDTRIVYSKARNEGSASIEDRGEDGFRTRTSRTLAYSQREPDAEPIGEEILAEDYYAPIHAVEERSIYVREPDEEEEEEDPLEEDDRVPWEEDDDWFDQNGGDAFNDWLDEGAPGDFEDWLEENAEDYFEDFENGPDGDSDFDFGSDPDDDLDFGNGSDSDNDSDNGSDNDSDFDFDFGSGNGNDEENNGDDSESGSGSNGSSGGSGNGSISGGSSGNGSSGSGSGSGGNGSSGSSGNGSSGSGSSSGNGNGSSSGSGGSGSNGNGSSGSGGGNSSGSGSTGGGSSSGGNGGSNDGDRPVKGEE
ncbi:VanW family protein [Alkalicoccus urumqiensis]|uniref:G5 domain-containing protein n=1 Tax=Alkalicoccus urumqiensis TaxID=1548213 RepID=A0A2P6MF55_ALKUR|nr:VanW family protein [Alkalicoccus urumqiensis]PRO64904.1 hypothetical protein C6I21_12220 [Alkalicoccus urumqiensis]